MKRLFCLMLALLMVCGMLTACNEADKPEETTTEATTTETTTTETTTTETTTTETTTTETTTTETTTENQPAVEYAVFTEDGVSFMYPASWQKLEGFAILVDMTTGNNISIVKEPAVYDYSQLNEAKFTTDFLPTFQSMGIEISSVSIAQTENALGTKMTFISMITTQNGVDCQQIQYVVTVGNYHHIVTYTEMEIDVLTQKNLFDSLTVTDVSEAVENKVYDNWAISFEYPGAWSESTSNGVLLLSEGMGNNITLVSEPATDLYRTITAEEFRALIAPSLESQGLTVSDVTLEQQINPNDVKMTVITYNISQSSLTLVQTVFIVNAGSDTYTVTVTEVGADTDIPETVFNTLKITFPQD